MPETRYRLRLFVGEESGVEQHVEATILDYEEPNFCFYEVLAMDMRSQSAVLPPPQEIARLKEIVGGIVFRSLSEIQDNGASCKIIRCRNPC